ncbi:MmgE/PrpD family protein [Gimibacter soli]|uniref:MmgE/PrpD family protein n=1 Tax=Gimibacter soli TaxID=3024400 RepID=A0AAE9XWW9_9PROT|nr:MmgE/PrpD family protein [Gimibacter soli]WCL54939.1 MmgE/PrpD family protein [Gimibacter soli]
MTFDPDNPLHAIARWTAETPDAWSPLARTRARDAFIDVIACMVPGAHEDVTRRLIPLAADWGRGDCRTVGYGQGLSAPMAALVGGTAAHALDFDDNFDPAKAHATAVLAPALLAVAEARGMTGAALIDAYIVGLQIIGRVGQGVNPFHRSRGWHATATVGAVGSAAGVARLIGLDAERAAHAVSIATSLAGGFMSQFGTMTKPLHAGLAARGAVEAALMAEAGITAGANTLHGPHGMGALMVGPDVAELRERMKNIDEYGQKVEFSARDIGNPLMIEKYGLKVKRFPNCGSVHRALDGLLELRAKHGFGPADVDHILVRAPAAHLRNLMYERPVTSAEAKFSLEYGLAVGLLTGNAGLGDYELEAIARPEVTALLPLVRKDYVEKLESEFSTQVHVTLKDGRTVSTEVDFPVGSTIHPLTEAQLWDKFDACVAGFLDADRRDKVKAMLKEMDSDMPVRELHKQLV